MKTILIIEDNAENMYLMRYFLEQSGYNIVVAEDGPEGLKVAAAELPDLILMDIGLPQMDGYEVTKRLKQDPVTAAIPVVALTAHAMVGDRQKAFDAGCAGHIEKPVNTRTLIRDLEFIMSSYNIP